MHDDSKIMVPNRRSGHLNDIEAEFARVKRLVEDPGGVAAEAQAQAGIDLEQV